VTRRTLILAYAAIVALAVIRVAATHRVFSATSDEPVHLITGYDWLRGDGYLADPSHPPLARIMAALPLFLSHPEKPEGSPQERADALMYANGKYQHNVASARRPLLLFVIIGVLATGLWTARYFGHAAGLLAAAFFASLPPLLGHAGLFTTDFALAALLPLAWLLLERFLDRPTSGRALAAGVSIGLAAVAKFSFVVFFPIGAAILIVWHWRGGETRTEVRATPAKVAIVVIAAFFVVWGMYRFQFTTLKKSVNGIANVAEVFLPRSMAKSGAWIDEHIPLPAPLYVVGVGMVQHHNARGHKAFLLGNVRNVGWWYYFPVVFFFKTPLPFLALTLAGIVLVALRRRDALPFALIAIAIMLSVLPSRINIGVRHILPIYPPLCALAAYATIVMWRNMSTRAGTAALVAWLFAGVAFAHPDYLAWFNEAAGEHPEHIAIDSNLDWGQDGLRLVNATRTHHIDFLNAVFNGNLMLHMFGVHADGAKSFRPEPGWYAISLTSFVLNPEVARGGFRWLDDYKYEMVGKSIRLYYVPKLPDLGPLPVTKAAATSDAAPATYTTAVDAMATPRVVRSAM
jgi:4-amino-4-deoxy-L-arabinose transferase-like glycosyltransferase